MLHTSAVPRRVLIADDDPIFTSIAVACLEATGFATSIARDGLVALEALERERPDAAVIDLDMPRIDGFRLIGLIRSLPRCEGVGILVISSSRCPTDYEEALALGADAYQTKPINWSLLATSVLYVLSARRSRNAGGAIPALASRVAPL